MHSAFTIKARLNVAANRACGDKPDFKALVDVAVLNPLHHAWTASAIALPWAFATEDACLTEP